MGLEPVQGGHFWSIPTAFYSSLINHLNIFHEGIHSIINYHFDGRVLTSGWAKVSKLVMSGVRAR